MNHHFSHVHASFWLGIEQYSNRRRNLVPDESSVRDAWQTHVPETPAPEKRKSIYGAIFWGVCHVLASAECWYWHD